MMIERRFHIEPLHMSRYAVPLSLDCYGLRDTTPSYAVIFLNIIPLVTFILSLILRQIGSKPGSLKIAGVLLSVGGTILISLYKGSAVHLWNSIQQHHKEVRVEIASFATNQLRGTVFLAGNSLAFAWWYLIQRVKLFRLNDEQGWDDYGAGHVTMDYLEIRSSHGVIPKQACDSP